MNCEEEVRKIKGKVVNLGINHHTMENLVNMLKDNIENLVNNINKNPRMVLDLGKVVAKAKFDLSFMSIPF